MTISLRLSEAARVVGGTLHGNDGDFAGVFTDSRAPVAGALFVALRGPRFDGHAFAEAAVHAGAAGVMVAADAGVVARPAIAVADTRIGLGGLAAHWRRVLGTPLVAVTGSNGKTTVKEMVAACLRAHAGEDVVLATVGNLNNDVGVPLTLFGLGREHRYAVAEMGMNHPGELAYLTRMAAPDVAVINNAGTAHVGTVGSEEAIARAKGEILEGLGPDGVAVINGDDTYAAMWRSLAGSRRVIAFGLRAGNDVRGEFRAGSAGIRVSAVTPAGTFSTTLAVLGIHNVMNALAATAAAVALGAPLDAIASGLAVFRGVKGRLARLTAIHGATLIDDTYNANPDSVKAALAVLAEMPGRHILVLGDMGELGARSDALHADVGRAAREAGIERLLAFGGATRHAAGAFGAGAMFFERIEELLAEIENALAPDVTVLVKGSRFMEMERVVKSFACEDEEVASHAA